MKNEIIISSDSIRKLKNRIHKKVYNKKKGINDNLINEFTLIYPILGVYVIKELGRYFINKILFDSKKENAPDNN